MATFLIQWAVLTCAGCFGAVAQPQNLLGLTLEQAMGRLLLRPDGEFAFRDCNLNARGASGTAPGTKAAYLYVFPVAENPNGPPTTIRQLRREKVVGVGVL